MLKRQQRRKQQPSKQQFSRQQLNRQQLSRQQPRHRLTSSSKHSTVDSNGNNSISAQDTTRCRAMQVVEVNPHRKEAQCVSFVREHLSI